MAKKETVKNAEKLVEMSMKGNDASHDEAHVWRVRDLALSLAREEGLASNPESLEIVNIYIFCFFFALRFSLWIKNEEEEEEDKVLIFGVSFLLGQVELAALLHDIGY